MDGLAEFSKLAVFGYLTSHVPLSRNRALSSIIKFYITLPTAIFATMAVWGFIARVGSTVYIPLELNVAIFLTLGGIAATFVVMLVVVGKSINSIDRHLRSLLNERYAKHDVHNPPRLLLNKR